jgi:RNA polymerase sigma-70 factor (ECF subfamily)
LSILNDEEDAKDVMQETIVKIKFGAGQYRPGTNPKAWIFRIARNLSIDMVRMRKNN